MNKKDKNRIQKIRIAAMLILLVFAMFMPVEAQAAKLSKKSITLLKGKTYTLQLKYNFHDILLGKKTVWKISKRSVARFIAKKNTSVKVRAFKIGNTTISARIGKMTYRCKLRVVDPKLSSKSLNLNIGESKLLKTKGGTGTVKWKTNNPAMVTVNRGRVTAKRSGTAQITAVQNGKKMLCAVTVKKATTSPGNEEDKNNSKPEQPKEKKVWVVTKEAYIEFIPVYEETGYIQCITCGMIFEGEGQGEAYDAHENKHMDNGEEGRYTTGVKRVLIRQDIIDHPEEGYWKTIYE
ncbi:MAG: hypothetical protein RHS_5917 [Robinsoniella sp. RHS]|uniref:Ig-like domain-containing protein n=1 Tax=Robinsoniella sp. RHS TaxID=1504536 RepID=UPI00065A73AA|nr:MAG: hypothetical protein RHS_5917 [Robinsoniella sp. RHS]